VVPDGQDAHVDKSLRILNREAIIGVILFRNMLSSVRGMVGGAVGDHECALLHTHDAALDDMKAAVREIGGDGIVGFDFNYEVMGKANGMMTVAVSGTAVKMA